jgi:hypothetical protein
VYIEPVLAADLDALALAGCDDDLDARRELAIGDPVYYVQ